MTAGKDLLQRILSSEAKGEILTLFHKNPGLIDTLDGVSRRIGMASEELEADMNDFLEMGILKKTNAGKLSLYGLDLQKDREVQASLAEYFRSLRK